MLARRILFLLLFAAAAFAQSEDVFQRLHHAFAATGRGDAAVAALEQKNFIQVEQMLASENASAKPVHAELLSLQGAVHFLAGEMNLAVGSFQAASYLGPLRESDSFTYAMALIRTGAGTQSRALLVSLGKQHPGDAIYVYWLGKLDYDQRRYEEAVQELTRATELDPQSARAWDSLGLTFDMQGQMDQALNTLQKAVELNRTQSNPSPWPPHNLGYLLLRMNRPKEAEGELREAIRYGPQMPQAHYHLGRVLEKEGRDSEAVNEYASAATLDPSSPDACYSLPILYRKLNKETDANAMFAEYRKRKAASN